LPCPVAVLQLQTSFVKYFVFQACVWIKSFFMKLGLKHNKVRSVLTHVLCWQRYAVATFLLSPQ
jgi:hypothetical protein